MKGNKSVQKAKSAQSAVTGSGYGGANVKGPSAKPFNARVKQASGSKGGDPGGKYDVSPLTFQHNYSEAAAAGIVKRLHSK